MSPITKKFFTASLIYLALGLLAQAVTVFDTWLGFNPFAFTAATAIQQILLLGWLTQLGLALVHDRWLSPAEVSQRNLKPSVNKSSSIVFILFNLGLPLVIMGQPGLALFGGSWLAILAALGGVLQFLAGMVFVGQVWRALRSS